MLCNGLNFSNKRNNQHITLEGFHRIITRHFRRLFQFLKTTLQFKNLLPKLLYMNYLQKKQEKTTKKLIQLKRNFNVYHMLLNENKFFVVLIKK